jgi:hypothetical protein
VDRGNGTATTYGYDAVDRLTSLTQDLGSTAISGSWYVDAHGYGSNSPGFGALNQWFGPGIFTGMLHTYVMVVRSRLGH